MSANDDDSTSGAGQIAPLMDSRLAQLAEENRQLREALRAARMTALEMAALACAAAEVPSEAGGVWYLGLTDESTRQACIDAVHRLLHAERAALATEQRSDPAHVVRLGR